MVLKENFNLKEYNSYKVEAFCAKAYFPETEEDIYHIYQHLKNEDKIILGGGYNTILSKNFYTESFIIFDNHFAALKIDSTLIKAQAGANMKDISELALENSLAGVEVFYDIPSSFGGAIVMNAGAGGEEIKDVLVSVKYFNPGTLSFHTISKEEIGFEYRNSFFQRNPSLIIIEAELQLHAGDKEAIQNKMMDIKNARWAKQPRDYPNAGSVFKRPKGRFVGPMIDELGLKGFSIGGAQVSDKHSGFILNKNKASGKNIIDLINFIKAKVHAAYGVDLEIEQRIV